MVRGDYAKSSVLNAVGLLRARSLVVADDEPDMTSRVVSVVRGLSPDIYLVALTHTYAQARALKQAGANAVISEEYAVTERLVTHVLGKRRDRLGRRSELRRSSRSARAPARFPHPRAAREPHVQSHRAGEHRLTPDDGLRRVYKTRRQLGASARLHDLRQGRLL